MKIHPLKRTCWALATLTLVFLAQVCRAQDGVSTLTNHDVVTLAEAGFGEQFIIEVIATSRTEFDTTADGIANLKKQGVKEDIIRAMRSARPAETGAPKPEAAASGATQPVRVFVEASSNTLVSPSHSPAADVVEAFVRNCPGVTVTSRKDAATFVVVLDRSTGKLLRPGTSKMVVFDRAGDTVYGTTVRALGKAVHGFCTSKQRLTGSSSGEGLPGSRFAAR